REERTMTVPYWQPPSGMPPTPEQPPPKKRHRLRWVLLSIACGLALIIGLAVAYALSANHRSSSTSGSAPTVSPESAPSTPALNYTQQNYVDSMRSRYNFSGDISDHDILSFGQGLCQLRSSGGPQADAESDAKQGWTHMSASDAYNMARMAESDLCP